MKKKQIIAWSIVVGVVLSVVLICSLVFTLRKVDYQLTAVITQENRSRLFASGRTKQDVESKISESAKFDIGGNLLFMKFDKSIAAIEKANPYVRVEKIVRRFPNKITVYYSEREAVGLLPVKDVENAYYVVDSTLKVLDQTSSQENRFNLPIIDYYGQSFSANVGDFIDSPLKSFVTNFVTGAYSGEVNANGQTSVLYEDVMGRTSKIVLKNKEENNPEKIIQYHLTANNGSSVVVEVWRADYKLSEKVSYSWMMFINVISKRTEQDPATLIAYFNSNNQLVLVDKGQTA